ncbi:MAG TPA: hypothetical protein VLF89_01770 [Candidatus Saccharimonadales bacterium]|nr:hypothetical protein [Candidatus Saccharimonadales bacterium]
MEIPIQEELLPNDSSKQGTFPIQNRNRIVFVSLIIFLLVSTLLFFYFIFKSHEKTSRITSEKKEIPLIDYKNAVFSSDEKTFFLTDLKSKKTTTIDMHTNMPFEVAYGQLVQYNNVLSPDKKSALFLKDHNIWKMDFQTKKATQLTTIGRAAEGAIWSIDAEFPIWSPNGHLIYYSVNADPPNNVNTYPGMQTPSDIKEGTWLMNADGKQQKFLPLVINPRGWMPDNKTILFADQPYETSDTKSYDSNTGKLAIFVKNLRISSILWDTNGTKGVYTKSDLSVSYLIDNKKTILETLPHYETPSSQNILHTFLLSPDGKYILITKEASINVDVFLFNTLTKEKIQLPITFDSNTKPFWSKDSTQLIYAKKTRDNSDLFIYDTNSHQQRQITDTASFTPSSIDY